MASSLANLAKKKSDPPPPPAPPVSAKEETVAVPAAPDVAQATDEQTSSLNEINETDIGAQVVPQEIESINLEPEAAPSAVLQEETVPSKKLKAKSPPKKKDRRSKT